MSNPTNRTDTLEKQPSISVEKDTLAQKLKQKKLLIILTIVFLMSLITYSLYWFIYLSHFQSTDDAYVNGNIVPVTSQVMGNIIAIDADDTTFVQQGHVLVRLDKTDSQAIFEQAKATLELTLRQTAQYFLRNAGLQAAIDARQASVQQASIDLKRRQRAVNIGGVSKEDLTHAQDTFTLANSSLIEAQSQWQANRALINNISIAKHPAVLQAIAKCRQAYFNVKRTIIYAPTSGYIAKRIAQVGQRVTMGSLLMAIVPLEEVWVDANFKEKQLRLMRAGQPVRVTADLYGTGVVYHGHVVGFSGGTGSAFALLPAQNATGNWIKVVQRLPVRIVLDRKELQKHPLRIGLSMQVTVDTSHVGKALDKAIYHPVYQTNIFNSLNKQADDMIANILHKNLSQLTNTAMTPLSRRP